MNRLKKIGLWVLQILLALLFVTASLPKLTNNPGIVERFHQWGYPEKFHLVVGTVELGGSIGLLIPPAVPYAASALAVIMVGASVTHLVNDEMPRVGFTAVVLALLLLVASARRPAFLRRRQT